MTREEAINEVKKAMPTMWKETKEALSILISELAESEDERLIKAAVWYLEHATERCAANYNGITPKQIITYLEKQKPVHFELKAGNWYICHHAYCCRADSLTVKEGERFQCEKDGIVKGFVIKEPEKYFTECSAPAPMEDEQKPVEVKPRFKIGDTLKKKNKDYTFVVDKIQGGFYLTSDEHFFPIEEQDSWELLEQKPVEWNKATINGEPIPTENHSVNIPLAVWSEEDEALFELLHQCVCRCINDDRMDYSERDKISKTMIPFIEKLQTLHPQQQTICDEKYVPSREMILAIWELGHVWKETNTTDVTQREYIQKHWKESSYYDKLKSTNPQPHTVSIKDATKFGNLEYERGVKDGIQHEKNHQWKPSEDQMEAFKNIFGNFEGYPMMKSLYNDLKKLM